jgi:4-hydroxy-3-polyprenylbenzoate decarboxylase
VAAGSAWVVGVSGASGAVFARRFVELLEEAPEVSAVHLVVSRNARKVIREEMSLPGLEEDGPFPLDAFLGHDPRGLELHEPEAMEAPISSGSHPVEGMVVLPCSMGTLAGIVTGTSRTLIQRAAEVQLKERRRLVLCFREAPLSRVHLRNLLDAHDAGATVMPIAPPFYLGPGSLEEMVDGYCARVMHTMGLEHPAGASLRYKAEA